MKDVVILGGPNGAGKTTAARVLLNEFFHLHLFLNADEIAREISPDDPDRAAIAAGRRMIELMRQFVRNGHSFGFETTCAGKSHLPLLQRCRQEGWRTRLLFFWLPSPEAAVIRVQQRVREGGHDVPAETIRRRFYAGIRNMLNLYLPLATDAEIYDNSDSGRVLIAEKRIGRVLVIRDTQRWAKLEEVSR